MAYTHNAPNKTGKVFMSRSLSRIWWPTLLAQSHASYTHLGNWHNDFFCVQYALQCPAYSGKGPASPTVIRRCPAFVARNVAAEPKGSRMPTPQEKQAPTQIGRAHV